MHKEATSKGQLWLILALFLCLWSIVTPIHQKKKPRQISGSISRAGSRGRLAASPKRKLFKIANSQKGRAATRRRKS